jgi:2-succinyl-5-enolpyruvyl-6-hydroxy-3-cyclohexene-1-carboxylate synthase
VDREIIAKENELWAWQIIELLQNLGINHFFIAPGSRSSPLTLAAASHPLCTTTVHFDERSLSFAALGFSKASQNPSAIIVTSGTAVGNLMPAIMEAHHDHIPMLVMTADRPPELRDCGASQTTHQVDIFSKFVRWHCDIACPTSELKDTYLSSLLSYAAFKTKTAPRGPVHLNFMFREPLHTKGVELCSAILKQAPCQYLPSLAICSEQAVEELAQELGAYSFGIITVGSIKTHEEAESIATLSHKLSWPIFCDISSRFGSLAKAENSIKYFDMLTEHIEDVDCVLHLGKQMLSKNLSTFLRDKRPQMIVVADHPDRQDPLAIATKRVLSDITWFANTLEKKAQRAKSSLLSYLKHLDGVAGQKIENEMTNQSMVSAPSLFHTLSHSPLENFDLFIGNSMPIRDADLFFHPPSFNGKIFVNRGLAGIDGNISTAYGIHRARSRPMAVIIGDLTCMHDMNALTLLSNAPIAIFVINNSGGGIFSFLGASEKIEHFETHMALSHQFTFEKLAAFSSIRYEKASSLDEITTLLKDLDKSSKALFIEINTDRKDELLQQKQIKQRIKHTLCLACAGVAT